MLSRILLRFTPIDARPTLADARARAARGAAYLDGASPGWAGRVDPATLELADGAQCVLGQLHGEFRFGLLRSRVWDGSSAPSMRLFKAASPTDLGFHACGEGDMADLDYGHLTRAWREEIRQRTGESDSRWSRHRVPRGRRTALRAVYADRVEPARAASPTAAEAWAEEVVPA
jgi:hypothetical protein